MKSGNKAGSLSVGVIGAGNMGRNHVRVLSSMPEFELVGLYDINATAATALAEQFGVRSFATAEELYQQVDAVHIVVPSFLHRKYACAAAGRGLAVLVEKPIALSLADADAIIAACKQNNVVLCVGHVERYNPAIVTLASIIAQEELVSLDLQRLSPFDGRIIDADVVQDLMIHDLDILNSLVPEKPMHISSQGVRMHGTQLDYAQALLCYDSGIVASLTASRITESKVRTAHIHTKNAYISVDLLNRSIEISRKTSFKLDVGYEARYRQESVVEKVFVPFKEPLVAEFEEFARCIQSKALPKTSGGDARRALDLCQRISDGAAVAG
jgi:predicted dehydrogenase